MQAGCVDRGFDRLILLLPPTDGYRYGVELRRAAGRERRREPSDRHRAGVGSCAGRGSVGKDAEDAVRQPGCLQLQARHLGNRHSTAALGEGQLGPISRPEHDLAGCRDGRVERVRPIRGLELEEGAQQHWLQLLLVSIAPYRTDAFAWDSLAVGHRLHCCLH